jgi:hypothetical protein
MSVVLLLECIHRPRKLSRQCNPVYVICIPYDVYSYTIYVHVGVDRGERRSFLLCQHADRAGKQGSRQGRTEVKEVPASSDLGSRMLSFMQAGRQAGRQGGTRAHAGNAGRLSMGRWGDGEMGNGEMEMDFEAALGGGAGTRCG